MTRLRGRALRGRRVHASSPAGHWHTTTMISSVRVDGSTACLAIPGPANAEIFRTYVQEVLGPTLLPGDIVVMDNLSAHKDAATLAHLASLGVEVLFLPPYSPDLNPIEKMWSKIKNRLRSLAARSEASLVDAMKVAFSQVTSQDALGWFISCGYSFI